MEQRYSIALLILFLFSCTKEDIKETEITQEITPEVVEWNTLSERYSAINENTSYFKNQEYVTDYLSASELKMFDHYTSEATYSIFGPSTIISDFNGDNKEDLFAHAISFSSDKPYSYYKGKFIFVDDIRGKQIKTVYNSDYYFGVTMAVNDFNNDGKNDVLVSSHDTKQNTYHEGEDTGGFQDRPMTKPTIITFERFGISSHKVGAVQDTHAITSGDVNNDGLVDFIQFPIPGEYQGEWDYFEQTPQVSINTGDFNFNTYDLITGFQYESWNATGYELFDINNDNFLDVVVGWEIGAVREEGYLDHYSTQLKDAVVLWGNGTGTYTLSDMTILEESSLSSSDRHSAILGFGFSDYDTDGDIDVIITTTREEPGADFDSGVYYDSYYLLLFDNLGGKAFTETLSIEGNVDESRTSFTNFFKLMSIDFDDDGKPDLIPFGIANYGQNSNYVSNLYWKNTENTYRRSW